MDEAQRVRSRMDGLAQIMVQWLQVPDYRFVETTIESQLKFEMMETLTQTMADKETALWLSMVMSDPQMEQLVIYCEEMVK